MDAFSRAEVTAVKRVITCRTDRFRPPYGRRVEDHPRMCVFAGTTNRDDWHRDEDLAPGGSGRSRSPTSISSETPAGDALFTGR